MALGIETSESGIQYVHVYIRVALMIKTSQSGIENKVKGSSIEDKHIQVAFMS